MTLAPVLPWTYFSTSEGRKAELDKQRKEVSRHDSTITMGNRTTVARKVEQKFSHYAILTIKVKSSLYARVTNTRRLMVRIWCFIARIQTGLSDYRTSLYMNFNLSNEVQHLDTNMALKWTYTALLFPKNYKQTLIEILIKQQ